MWDAEKDDDDAFERRLDNVVREIGERGKALLPEAVTPFREQTPAPVPAPAPSPAPALAPAPAPVSAPSAPVHLGTPPSASAAARSSIAQNAVTTAEAAPSSMSSVSTMPPDAVVARAPAPTALDQSATASVPAAESIGMVGSLSQVSTFMESQQRMQMQLESKFEARLEKQEAKLAETEARLRESEADVRDCEAKLAAQRQEYEAKLRDCEAKLRDCEAKLDAQAKNCVPDVQLERLQERLDALYQAKLLSDDEMFALEDLVADFIECRSSVTASSGEIGTSAESVRKLVGMCEAISKDSMLARQLRRKFL